MMFTYDCSYMTNHIWLHAYEYTVYDVHIWLIIHDWPHMITWIWIYRIWCSHMSIHIWLTTYDYTHMNISFMMIIYEQGVHIWTIIYGKRHMMHIYEWSYMIYRILIINIWFTVYDDHIWTWCSHMIVDIWFTVYDLPYMIYILLYSYMIDHIWLIIYDHLLFIYDHMHDHIWLRYMMIIYELPKRSYTVFPFRWSNVDGSKEKISIRSSWNNRIRRLLN